MSAPIYLPLRDRLVLRHAAGLIERAANELHASESFEGVLVDLETRLEHADLTRTAKSLRRIARERTNKECAQ